MVKSALFPYVELDTFGLFDSLMDHILYTGGDQSVNKHNHQPAASARVNFVVTLISGRPCTLNTRLEFAAI